MPKWGSSDRRVILDLSYPDKNSVNSGIPKETYLSQAYKLEYLGIDHLVQLILEKGRDCKILKIDVHRAYRLFRIDPGDYNLLGIQ